MKTIGMLCGMSWESSAVYYQLINREVQRRVGGVHSAKLLMHSFDFGEIGPVQRTGDWSQANRAMAEASAGLERSGADAVIMCCNTMHCATPEIERAIRVPFLHIADPLGQALRKAGLRRVALLGTSHTMARDDIIRGRLHDRYDITVLTPDDSDTARVSRVIYEELVRGQVLPQSRELYRDVIAKLAAQGAEGVILGCTELPLLVQPEDSAVPLFDTTTLHAMAAVDFALGTNS
ncbi:MAG TPA: aspartate/glutamate racemase family protein [Rhizomicrobium sp.]|nr:aspartate/glutamate racemase family protein [Rhizomicrobium sp.]